MTLTVLVIAAVIGVYRFTGVVTIEGEDLRLMSRSPGSEGVPVETQEGSWGLSKGKQLSVLADKEDSTFSFSFNVPSTGRYQVDIFMTHAYNYGILKFAIDNVPVDLMADFYVPFIKRSQAVSLGKNRLERGTHILQFIVAGKNSQSSGMAFGIDQIVLKKR